MTVALYCRVSTDEQAQTGFSIESQKERLEAFCKSQGWADYRFFVDDGWTGTNLNRPALQRMIRLAQEGKIETVVVYRLDRLSRKQLDVLYVLENVFEKSNVSFKSATEPFDTSTPLGKAMLGILAVFAQLERDTIVERTTMGRRQRVSQGLWYGGRIPFGYDWNRDNQQLLINQVQAELVREVYRMYLQGKSLTQIGQWLNKRTNERQITHASIREILDRPIYAGMMNNAGTLVTGNHEPIIDIETWQSVQRERQNRHEGRTPAGKYLLSGLLRCGICGGFVVHVPYRSKRGEKLYTYDYYMCAKKHRSTRGNSCSLPAYRVEQLEEYAVELLQNVMVKEKVLREDLKKIISDTDVSDNGEQLEAELSNIDAKIERWSNAFEDGEISPRIFNQRVQKLEAERKVIELRLEEIESPIRVDKTEEIIASLRSVTDEWPYLEEEEKSAVLRTAVKKIILKPNFDLTIEWNI